jgi:hypothetical protein
VVLLSQEFSAYFPSSVVNPQPMMENMLRILEDAARPQVCTLKNSQHIFHHPLWIHEFSACRMLEKGLAEIAIFRLQLDQQFFLFLTV